MRKKDSLDRFTGANFYTWQTRFKFVLQNKELWKLIITNDEKIPTTREAKALWELSDTKALAIIDLALGDEYLHHISNITTSKLAWEIFDKLFGALGKNSKINLKLQLFKLNMPPGGDFLVHLNTFNGLLSQLASIHAPVDKDDCIALLLKSLPDEYDNIVTTLLNMPALKINDVQSSLMDEYTKKKGTVLEVFSHDNAYFSKSKYKNKAGNKYNKQIKKVCNFCGKDNHVEEECFH